MATSLLEEWASRAGFMIETAGDEVLHGWGDMETAYDVRRAGALFTVTREDHGHGRPIARFSSEIDADRLLMLLFGRSFREANAMPRTAPASLADGAVLVPVGSEWELIWAGGSGWFSRRDIALGYSGVAALSLEELDRALYDPGATF